MSTTLVTTPSQTLGGRVAVVAGFALHAVAGVFVLSSGLMMPTWAIIALAVFWAAALATAIRQRHRPLFVLLTPVVTFAVWFLAGWAGETFLAGPPDDPPTWRVVRGPT
jgi:hypothetical protein